MSDFESNPPALTEPVTAEFPGPSAPEASPTPPGRLRRHLFRTAAVLAILTATALTALCVWISTATFENLVRKELISRLQSATGGRVEIRSFRWRPFKLEAYTEGLVIHGREAAGEAPYARVASLRVGVSIFGFWSPRILLRDLEVSQPAFHLIVYPDGSTNQPQPRKPTKSRTNLRDTLFDLKAGHVAIRQGEFDYENRAAAFDFQDRFTLLDLEASDVTLSMAYVPAINGNPESYRIETGASHLDVFRGNPRTAQAGRGQVEAILDLVRNGAYLRSFRLLSDNHELNVTGAVQDFAHPHWQARAAGELDLKLLDPATGYTFAPEGIAHLDLGAAGSGGQFRIDGPVHVERGSYVGTGVDARGFDLNAHVHGDPDHLLITAIAVKLRPGGQIDGEVALEHWLPPVPGAPVLRTVPQGGGRAFGLRYNGPVLPPPPTRIDIPVNGRVTAQFKDVSLDTLMDMVGTKPFLRLGLNTRLNGPALATWVDGDNRTLSVSANLGMSAPATAISGEAPASGLIDGIYTNRDGAVDLRKLDVQMPGSGIQARGRLGAYPLSSKSDLAVDLHSHNLWEFDNVLRDLGLKRDIRTGTAALPIGLAGEIDFHGNWTGSLVDPHLTGNARATQLTLEVPATANSGKPQFVHLDAIEAAGSYTGSRIAFDHAQLHKGQTELAIDGTLDATSGKTGPIFDANSVLHAHVRAAKVDLAELLALAGNKLPLTGALSAQIDSDGPLHSLGASGWVEVDGGAIYGEPVTRVRAQGRFANQQLRLTSLTASEIAGSLTATGSYDLKSHRFQIDASGAGFDVARIGWLSKQGLSVSGKLSFSITGSGTTGDPRLQARATLANLALGGEPLGGLELTARSANRMANYDMTTRLQGAQVTMHGETALSGENPTKADFEFSRFNIGALLKTAHLAGLNGESALAGKIYVEGPLARPEALRGEARLEELAVTVSGVHLHSVGGVHATLANSRVNLDPLHVSGEDTDLHVQGGLTLKDKRQLDLAASGAVNLKLAQSLDPDLTASGTTTFQVEAHGPLSNPGLRGRVDFHNGSMALEDLPNGLSQLHGHLEFNQNRLEVKSLTAMTGGGLLSLSGYLAYQNGIYADLFATGSGIRIRYPQGVSSLADAKLRLQGTQNSLLLSGNVLITRFTMSPDLDIAALAAAQSNSVQTIAAANAPSNHVRLDVRLTSSPQLNFQNAYAKLAGDVDLRLRGTLASPSLLGRISVTEGSAMIAGTRYELQRGEVSFTNPVRIQPAIDLNATAHVSDYDITLGLHGTPDKMAVTYRSDPPLPEADVVALLALGRTENQQRIYTQQQEQMGANPTTDLLLGGALNATVSSRVQKLFGAGSVKVDPNYLGALGNSTSRIIVEEQLGSNVTLTYATNVNTTAQQLIQAEVAINHHVSVLVARDESGVFSMVFKATRRYR